MGDIRSPISSLPAWAQADPLIVQLVRYYGYTLEQAYERAERVAIEENT